VQSGVYLGLAFILVLSPSCRRQAQHLEGVNYQSSLDFVVQRRVSCKGGHLVNFEQDWLEVNLLFVLGVFLLVDHDIET
jgi:hypothetical protein